MTQTHPTICRCCTYLCGVLVDVEDGRPVALRGDPDNPVYRGYACEKGRELPLHQHHPQRLLRPLARGEDGSYSEISTRRAFDEIAAKLSELIERHGPGSVALYSGTYAFTPATAALSEAFMRGIGSSMSFATGTIDQPGKAIANALHGRWLAGAPIFDEADAWLLVGTNPLISLWGGLSVANPSLRLREAQRRGLQLIVIDPRRSEIARRARLHLQPRPGEDPALLAGLIRAILRERLADGPFLAENASGLEELRARVEPFTPEFVARRADVPAEALLEAARILGHARKGGATAGTGPNMAPHGTLTEYLLLALHSVCGHWLRAGDRVANPNVLVPAPPPRAQPTPPGPGWGFAPELRVRGLTNTACGLPTAALPDEMLLPGEGRIRALINVGGNPLMAWPDQRRTREALRSLELLVCVDPKQTATGKLAHYVIPPRLVLETPAITTSMECLNALSPGLGYPVAYAQYAPALLEPPEGSDLIDDWELFYELARRLDVPLRVRGGGVMPQPGVPRTSVELDPERKPTTDEILELTTRGSRVPLAEVQRHPHGAVFDAEPVRVEPRDPDCDARLELANPFMLAELEAVAAESPERDSAYAYRLVSRRMPQVFNSQGRDHERLARRGRGNPAYLHPEDLAQLGIASGDRIEIASARAAVVARARPDPDLRRGVISMAHCFGEDPGDAPDPERHGASTALLVDAASDYEPFSGIPRMSAIPVHARAHRE